MTDQELMHQALEALEWASDMIPQQKEPVCDCPICKASDALRERLAQADFEQTYDQMMRDVHAKVTGTEQEPVAWVTGWHDGHCVIRAANPSAILPIGIALYTTPPRREWVGLTEEEVDECYYWKGRQWTTDELVRHVEAKLKEKNA